MTEKKQIPVQSVMCMYCGKVLKTHKDSKQFYCTGCFKRNVIK